eukprot:Hpha_TRINITY_DN202_c0_g1::TRINITY_DN202_c0_g1_i1::g.83544::m.83544/K14833/NOC2; nucleolar complex protein 2
MVRSNAPVKKSLKNFKRKGNLTRELKFRHKVRPVKRSMIEHEKKKEDREYDEMKKEEEEHRKSLRELEEHDPELKRYIQKADPSLLDFAEEQLSDAEEESPEEEAEGEDGEGGEGAEAVLTAELADSWLESLTKAKSLKGVRKCVLGLRVAAAQGYLLREGESGKLHYVIQDTAVFEKIVTTTASAVPAALNSILKRKAGSKKVDVAEGWERVAGATKAFLSALAKVVGDTALPGSVLGVVLRAVPQCVEFLAPFQSVSRAFLKSCLGACAHDDEGVRVLGYLAVRAMALPGALPAPFTDVCLKGLYLTFVKNARSFQQMNYSLISSIMNQCVDLCGIDLGAAYQHVFMYVRQLAVYLRAALQSGAGEEAFRHVYNWQYINSLRLWAMAVARYHDKRELFPLVYPLAQVACGVVELFPAPKSFPLHLLVLGTLNHLQNRTQVYIPTSLYLLRILSSPVFAKSYKKSTGTPSDLAFSLRAKKGDLSSSTHHESVLKEALYLLVEHLAIHSHSIGFPEFAFPILSRLRQLKKSVGKGNPRWGALIAHTVQKIESSRDWTLKRRKGLNFGPADAEKVAGWEAKAKEDGSPLVATHLAEKKKREEVRAMKMEAGAGGRKTIDEHAAEGEDDDDESFGGLGKAEDADVASDEDDEEFGGGDDDGGDDGFEEEEEPKPKAAKRRNAGSTPKAKRRR